jgi:hypothetical protein
MVGFLKTIESPAGQTIGVIRENGQVEDCAVVDPAELGGNAGTVRTDWALRFATYTFAASPGPVYDIVTEPGTLAGISAGQTIFMQPDSCLVGPFHSGSPAPQFGGAWLIVSKADDQEMQVQRVEELATSEQMDATGLITADAGTAAGVYQVETPPGGTIDVTAQVMTFVAPFVLGGDTVLKEVPIMPANTFADVDLLSSEARQNGVYQVTINSIGRSATLGVVLAFCDIDGTLTVRLWGTNAAPLNQSFSFIRLFP